MQTVEIEIVDLRKSSGDGKLKAFADVKVADAVVIKGFTVAEGPRGIFVSVPRKPGKDGQWFDTITVDEKLKAEIEDKVLEAYDREIESRA